MAIVSLLFSFIGRKLGDILLAIFGWSVTALFGRLSRRKQIAVSGALGLSIAWPLFVVGLIRPAVAGWALAMLPLESWVGPTPLRIAWGVLAIASPAIVGMLVHFAAPAPKGSFFRTVVGGYPLALGLFSSFLITAISVPVLKLVAIVRKASDTHVYVEARIGSYRRVVRELAEACARAGLVPEVGMPPAVMTLAFRVLRFFAGAAVRPILAEELMAIRAPGIEIVVYPSDVLLRGEEVIVARVRAMLSRTDLDVDAYVVSSARAQAIQDELGRLGEVVRNHTQRGQPVGTMAERRLGEIWQELASSNVLYDEWVKLEAIAMRLERRLTSHRLGVTMPLDRVEDRLSEVARRANAAPDSRGAPRQLRPA